MRNADAEPQQAKIPALTSGKESNRFLVFNKHVTEASVYFKGWKLKEKKKDSLFEFRRRKGIELVHGTVIKTVPETSKTGYETRNAFFLALRMGSIMEDIESLFEPSQAAMHPFLFKRCSQSFFE